MESEYSVPKTIVSTEVEPAKKKRSKKNAEIPTELRELKSSIAVGLRADWKARRVYVRRPNIGGKLDQTHEAIKAWKQVLAKVATRIDALKAIARQHLKDMDIESQDSVESQDPVQAPALGGA